MNQVIAIILGGGRGTRLFPLTLARSKPAVPIGGQVPAHRHPDQQLHQLRPAADVRAHPVQLREPEQAHQPHLQVRPLLARLRVHPGRGADRGQPATGSRAPPTPSARACATSRAHRSKEVLILSGDQLYQMDYRKFVDSHRRQVADVTVAVTPVTAEQASLVRHPEDEQAGPHRPLRREAARGAAARPRLRRARRRARPTSPRWASTCSTGRCSRARCATPRSPDFGRHVIPKLVPEARVQAYVYRGYWEDVGTIRSYYEANLALAPAGAAVRLLRRRAADLHPPPLPARDQGRAAACSRDVLISEGCIVVDAEVRRERARHPQPHRPGSPHQRQPGPGRRTTTRRRRRRCRRRGAATAADRHRRGHA